jgi:ABC-type Zn uptake system ZnuABC Zn-binding protein ZnuA
MDMAAVSRLPSVRKARDVLLLLGLLLTSGQSLPALRIVTTTTDLKSLTEAVGGDKLAVVAIVPPGADAEEYAVRPGDLSRVRDAQLVVRVGVDYDLWLDPLLRQAGKPALARGGPGHVDASYAVALLEVRGASIGETGGHAHGSGNPHYWLDPANAEIITGNILAALLRLDPSNASFYEQRRLDYLALLRTKIELWTTQLAPFAGNAIVAYHNDWAYFARRFRLNIATFVETRPGVPPSPAHLATLATLTREQNIRVFVRQAQQPATQIEFLAARGNGRVALLAASVGSLPGTEDYISLFEVNISNLRKAFTAPKT